MDYDISSQSVCTEEVVNGTSTDCNWTKSAVYQSFARNVDIQILKGKIIAYKIEENPNQWSDWYVPGYNDFKLNVVWNVYQTKCSGQEKDSWIGYMWADFINYPHKYIICRPYKKDQNIILPIVLSHQNKYL